MPQKGTLVRLVTAKECPWLGSDLPEGKEIYEFDGYTYGAISDNGIAVSDEPGKFPFYEVPLDAVSWAGVGEDVLTLPKDPARIKQLRAKLTEYESRLKKAANDDDEFLVWDSICKIAVLKTLLEDGRMDLRVVRTKLMNEHSEAIGRLRTAFIVIQDYCETGGRSVHGGTGLPKI